MSEYYIKKNNNSINRFDRYRTCDILKDIDTGASLLSTREINAIPESNTDKFHVVKSHEVTRLDLIAHTYYNNALMWWVIAQANDIYDPISEIPIGTTLRIPSLEVLYGNRGILL